ncbi:hypothetical protein M3Y99_01188500 [Aphelenchoides fujianensis]|nr:hypothetical protein M3Y99_01188500 [Aphelenchoides fujianensis]
MNLLLSFFFLLLLACGGAEGNIFYTDESSLQSTRANLSSEQVNRIQSQILHLLGLKRQPETHNADQFASNFMSALYARIAGGDANETFEMDAILEEFESASTIVSFIPKKIRVSDERFGGGLFEVAFHLGRSNETPAVDGRLAGARLLVGVDGGGGGNATKIRVFRRTLGAELISVGEREVAADARVVSLNVSRLVDEWLAEAEDWHRIFVEFVDEEDRVLPLADPAAVHLFAVGFFAEPPPVKARARRSVADEAAAEGAVEAVEGADRKAAVANQTESPAAGYPGFQRASALPRGRSNAKCSLRSLYVDFKDLGWSEWVVAPAGFYSDFCDGGCSFPLESSAPVNHAIVQSLVNLLDKKRAPAPSCAPVELQSQTILFLNQEQNLVMKQYKEMRVKNCGCR